SVFITSIILSAIITALNKNIAGLVGIPAGYELLVTLSAVILFIDSIAVLPFLKIRLERKAKKFASIKVLNITVNILLNILLIVVLNWGITAVFISNIIASSLSLIL